MTIMEWLLRPLMEKIMATTDEIKTQTAELLEAVRANADATDAVVTYVAGLKTQLTDVQQQLATAIQNQADPAALQEISDQLRTAVDEINADAVAEAALQNTDAEPTT